jgi:hypothetical protein
MWVENALKICIGDLRRDSQYLELSRGIKNDPLEDTRQNRLFSWRKLREMGLMK